MGTARCPGGPWRPCPDATGPSTMNLQDLGKHFELGPEIGRGGFGVVYRGTTRATGEAVAIKVLLEEPDQVARGRMAREASSLTDLRHPRLATFHGLFRDERGGVALVYQYIEGRPLEAVLRERLPGRARGLRWCRDLGEALDFLHQAGVVHRDVKPGNLIVGPDDRLTLLDFGLVRDIEAGDTVTQHGLVVGTPQYLAPEILLSQRASPASDVYAFGCLVHLLAAGDLPFPGESPGDLIDAHLRQEPPVFPGWAGPARAALAKEPTERPASALELVHRLETHEPSAATIRIEAAPRAPLDAATPKVAAQRSRLPVLPFLVSLGLAVGFGFWVGGPAREAAREPPPPSPPQPDPIRRPPRFTMHLIPTEAEATFGLPSSSLVPLPGDRVALGLRSWRIALTAARAGGIRLGPDLRQPGQPSREGLQLCPGPGESLWALGLLGSDDNALVTRIFRIDDPLRRPEAPPRDVPRAGSAVEQSWDLGNGTWVVPAPGPAVPHGAPGTVWISRHGVEPQPVEIPALQFRRRVSRFLPTPEGGVLMQIADLSLREEQAGTTVLELGPDDAIRWSLDIPRPGLVQARLTLAPEGVYLVHEDRLWLLERSGLRGEVTLDALRPLTEPIPDLASHSASRAPGSLYRSRHGVELWTIPPRPGILYGPAEYHWLRFAARPGEVPTALTHRSKHRTTEQLVVRDNSTGIHSMLETGNPDRLLVAMITTEIAGHLVVFDLARGELAWEQELRHPVRDVPVMPRTRPLLGPWPGDRGHWLLVPGTLDIDHGLVLERYFPPDGMFGRR